MYVGYARCLPAWLFSDSITARTEASPDREISCMTSDSSSCSGGGVEPRLDLVRFLTPSTTHSSNYLGSGWPPRQVSAAGQIIDLATSPWTSYYAE
jgi:hypothetical protein